MLGSGNRVVHLELHTSELAAARAFYGELLGWRPVPVPANGSPYLALELGGGLGGGLVQCPTGRPMWLPYVEVQDINLATADARRLGASLLLAPREGPSGWRSVVATAAGGELAFWQFKGGAG
jgi:predicted enzyme related to lactoylglutathione lyase